MESDDDLNDAEILSENEIDNLPIETIEDVNLGEDENADPNADTQDKPDEAGKKETVKPVVKRKLGPRPKLNEQTLRLGRGLPAIKTHFKNVKVKGKGYEEEDLNTIMKAYEYWCHRLVPSFRFDDCIDRLEKLSNKKPTKILLKRYRLGMEDFIIEAPVESDHEKEAANTTNSMDDQFNQILATAPEPEQDLTEEQLERIRQNKIRALELRKERLSRLAMNQSINIEQSQTNETENQNMSPSKESQSQVNEDLSSTNNVIENEDEEVDLDNMLDMLNENPDTAKDLENSRIKESEKVSNAIRSSLFKSLLDRNGSDEEINETTTSQPNRSHRKHNIDTSGEDSDCLQIDEDNCNSTIIQRKRNASESSEDSSKLIQNGRKPHCDDEDGSDSREDAGSPILNKSSHMRKKRKMLESDDSD